MMLVMQKCDENGFFIEKDLIDPYSETAKALFKRENARMMKWKVMLPDIKQLMKKGDDKRSEFLT